MTHETMIHEADPSGVIVELTAAELQLVLTSLRYLLESEDDPAEIVRLKRLIERLGAS